MMIGRENALTCIGVDDPFRPTRDLDLLGHGDNDAQSIAETLRTICAQPVADDGVTFDVTLLTAAAIREEGGLWWRACPYDGDHRRRTCSDPSRYRCWRRHYARTVEIDYPALADAPAPCLRAYPVVTWVVEKFEALVTLGINSRLKDFYDLWSISRTLPFRQANLLGPVNGSAGKRQSDRTIHEHILSHDHVAILFCATIRLMVAR